MSRNFGRVTWRRQGMPFELHMLQWLRLTSGEFLRNFTCTGTLAGCHWLSLTSSRILRNFNCAGNEGERGCLELHMLQWLSLTSGGILWNFTCTGTLAGWHEKGRECFELHMLQWLSLTSGGILWNFTCAGTLAGWHEMAGDALSWACWNKYAWPLVEFYGTSPVQGLWQGDLKKAGDAPRVTHVAMIKPDLWRNFTELHLCRDWRRKGMPFELLYTCCNDYAWPLAEFYGTSPGQGLW